MVFKNRSKKDSALNLNIKEVGMTILLKFLGITLGPHLKWKYLVRLNNDKSCGDSNLNIEESLLLVYKSWIRSMLIYENACWLDQSRALIRFQNVQNRALRFCFWRLYQRNADYINQAIQHCLQSIVDFSNKKRPCQLNTCKSTIDHLI